MDFEKFEAALPLGAFSTYDMEAIYPALKSLKADDVYLEVGVDKGKSLAFAAKVSKAQCFGIDKENNLDYEKAGKVYFWHMSSNKAAGLWTKPINVLFIDGDHSYEGVKDDWDNFSPFVVKDGWVFFHDADITSPGVVKVTEEINKGWSEVKYSSNLQCSMAWVKKL